MVIPKKEQKSEERNLAYYKVEDGITLTYIGHMNPQKETTTLKGILNQRLWAPLGAVDKKRDGSREKVVAYYLFTDFEEKLNKDGEHLCIAQ